jgi:hypothetical protein
VSPVQPSTSRPEFTALLDQLRSGTRPGDPAPQAARRPGRVPVPPLERQGEPADPRLLVDRTALRGLGVPASWTSALPAGDRFSAVLSMLDRLPVPDVDPDADVVAVVGPAGTVRLEAHRTAVDLAVGDRPRPVVTVPASGRGHEAALLRARETPGVVVAVPAEALHDADAVNATLRALGATAVVVVVEAQRPLEETRRWLAALDRVDAIAVEGAGASAEPAAVLHLGRPVVRLDGIPIDAVTWAALLCARLAGGDAAGTAG